MEKTSCVRGLEDLVMLTWQYPPNWSAYAVPIRIPADIITEIDKLSLNFMRKLKRLRIAKMREKNKDGGLTLPDFKK